MFISATVSTDLSGLQGFEKKVKEQLNGSAGPIHDVLLLWAFRYRSYIQLRFDTFSKGGGNWKPLANTTIEARRKGTKSNVKALRDLSTKTGKKTVPAAGGFAILRNTGTLFAALAPIYVGSPGALEEQIKYGIRVGYGGPQRHIGKGAAKSSATIADIASFHQNGAMPRLPKREIIVDPSPALIQQMSDDMEKALKELAK